MPKILLLVLTALLLVGSANAQSKYVYRTAFMCIDIDTCKVKTAVENRYPESALYLNVTTLNDTQTSITAGKDWTAKTEPVGFIDTSFFAHTTADSAYFIDANNDGRQDILFSLTNKIGNHILGTLDKWIVLLQDEHGTFTKVSVQQYGLPLWRRNKHNYWLSTRLVDDTVTKIRYWVEDLFDLKGEEFVNVGAKFGFPKIKEYGGKLPRLTKKLKQELRMDAPGSIPD
jgi:hypothetical protein